VVQDTGIGIAAEAMPRIFELFTQIPSERSATTGGLGIGLALVRALVELHGGEIHATSPGVDQGSEFTVRLPLLNQQADARQAAAAADPVEAVPSRIVRERGRYVIELHSAAIGPVLEMLTKATGATVRGSDVVLGNAARITRTVTTDSPLEAWQAVFGGVVNFAASCTRAACDVRFVRSADPALAARQQRLPSGAAPEPGSPDERDDQGTTAPAIAPSVVARTAPPAVPAPADDQPAAEN